MSTSRRRLAGALSLALGSGAGLGSQGAVT